MLPRILPLLTLLALPAHVQGQVELEQLFPMTAAQQEELRLRIRSDPEAAARWAELRSSADRSLTDAPRPLAVIHYEGLLDTDPRRVDSQVSIDNVRGVVTLAYAYAATGETRYRDRVREHVLAWAQAYRPTGNPINENKLEPVWFGYGMLRASFSETERREIEAWLREIARREIELGARAWEPGAWKNNWDTKRYKIVGGIGFVLRDRELIEQALRGVRLFVADALFPDGSSTDLRQRDALSYHNSALLPVLALGIIARQQDGGSEWRDLYDRPAPAGSTLRGSVDFVVPYASGERTRAEWVNTTVELDRRRAAAGLEQYQPGRVFRPEQATDLLTLAAYFDESHRALVAALHGNPGTRHPSWLALIVDLLRETEP